MNKPVYEMTNRLFDAGVIRKMEIDGWDWVNIANFHYSGILI